MGNEDGYLVPQMHLKPVKHGQQEVKIPFANHYRAITPTNQSVAKYKINVPQGRRAECEALNRRGS